MSVKVHELGSLGRLGKRVAPLLTRVLMQKPFAPLVPLLEAYLAVLQGKGAATGWDMTNEAKVASRYVSRANGVVFDIGANRGEWSTALYRLLDSKDVRFYLFEPSQTCYAALQALANPQFELVCAAVGAVSGSGILYTPEPGSPYASLTPRRDTWYTFPGDPYQEAVPIITVDDFIAENGLSEVDLMKIDVEGHELSVLKGAQTALAEGRIRALTFEFGSGHVNTRTFFRDFWDLLVPRGYALYRIAPGAIVLPIQDYYEDLEYFRGVSNYLALHV